MDQKKIGQFISERRKDLGLTQQQLADQLGVTNKAVSKWETGEGYPDITIVLDLSQSLCVSADELLKGEMVHISNEPCLSYTNGVKGSVLPMGFAKKEKKSGKSWMGFLCIVAGILLVLFWFVIELEHGNDLQYNSVPVYSVAMILLVGGFIFEIMNKMSQSWVSYRDTEK